LSDFKTKGFLMKKSKKSHKISDHFSKKDFECKCGECKYSVRVSLGLVGGLELLRTLAQKRITIKRAFQCPKAAEKEVKFRRNLYATGLAADIVIADKAAEEAFLLAEKVPEFITIGLNLDENCIHVNTRKDPEKKRWVQKNQEEIILNDENRPYFFTS